MSYKEVEKQKEYQRAWRRKKIRRLKAEAIVFLGGRCVGCGTSDVRVLDFDHIVPVRLSNDQRERQIPFYNSIISGKETNIQLLCANCHRIKTAEDFGWQV